ncbi:hypothetical protein OSB04_007085 [Centaurea solstitialis]|uniref:Uncharacterized protein n=1 Tax=Centaurea solstitialis TaxID=347529 RepID=A0AA38TVX4_9ASTR|nr:hypothetical protein OSB04_007085 [Centaurea solstitialis]
MGSSESTLSSSQNGEDGITIVSDRSETVDPVLEKLQSLKIGTPILTSKPTESSLADILVRKPSSNSSDAGVVDPKVILDLFSAYQQWQEEQAHNINKRQEELENKIKAVDALAVKLFKKYKFSDSAMKSTSRHLSGGFAKSNSMAFPTTWRLLFICLAVIDQYISIFRTKLQKMHTVHQLQVEVGELKGRLTEVVSNCAGICKRIAAEGPESLHSSVKPFTSLSSMSKDPPSPL